MAPRLRVTYYMKDSSLIVNSTNAPRSILVLKKKRELWIGLSNRCVMVRNQEEVLGEENSSMKLLSIKSNLLNSTKSV